MSEPNLYDLIFNDHVHRAVRLALDRLALDRLPGIADSRIILFRDGDVFIEDGSNEDSFTYYVMSAKTRADFARVERGEILDISVDLTRPPRWSKKSKRNAPYAAMLIKSHDAQGCQPNCPFHSLAKMDTAGKA